MSRTVFAKTCLPPLTSLPRNRSSSPPRPLPTPIPAPKFRSEFLSLWEDFLLPNPVSSEELVFLSTLVIVLLEGAFSY